ncbi:MAG: tRNA (N6-isopentenyl adenosine(37)-C2)-methylthiotransferase MiaB [Chloroflexota bacterium]|nr:tRNA (N6-isopentenyl adenosine(37)-C2)-methylthiotransferase MiaB [Chloroflexota bacterium]
MAGKKYHIWTIGCQMNVADSQRLASTLEKRGYAFTHDESEADILVVNTCVVRQQAEDKATGRLGWLKQFKNEDGSGPIIGLMGCMVGVRNPAPLREQFPWVDVFLPPSEPGPLLALMDGEAWDADAYFEEVKARRMLNTLIDDATTSEVILPAHERGELVTAHVPIIYGCNHMCSFCIIPYRRGVERSRMVGDVVGEVRSLVDQGVREVTLLGQIVDRYGYDIEDGPRLQDLLYTLNDVEGLERIRFLTSHPNYMSDEILDAVASLPKVMEQIEIPVQAGNNEVLKRMRRGYTVEAYHDLVYRIRERVPGAAVHGDIIVGFPGETEEQFMDTYDLIAELKPDKQHIAKYSPRPHTPSSRWEDDVPMEEKERRHKALDDLMERISTEINATYLDSTQEVLVEEKHRGKWKGRTRTNKLVFFEDDRDRKGELVEVQITFTGPWSLQGVPIDLPESRGEEAGVEGLELLPVIN